MTSRLLVAWALCFSAACVLTSGPDCTDACDKILQCEQLDRTFRLACSNVGVHCFDRVAECAECIDTHTCEQLVEGACDLKADGSELCLVKQP